MITIHLGDCLEVLKTVGDSSVDLVATDLPYGTTNNKWDVIIPFDKLWEQLNRVCKNNANMIFTTSQPFTSMLICSNLKNFRYEVIWQKTLGSGQLNINRQPLKVHESIVVFYREFGTYNEQKTKGEPYKITRKLEQYGTSNYNTQKDHVSVNEGTRRAKSVITISNPRIKGGHPTQKPVGVMDYIIKTYSNEGDIVLDPTMGTGTTGASCYNLRRNFMGIEKDKTYYEVSENRLKELEKKLSSK